MFKNKGLHFGYLNINTILQKIEQLRSILINSNISILWITETKLDNSVNNDKVEINSYNLMWSDKNKKEGGIAFCIKNSISFNYHESLIRNLENILVDFLLPESKPITLDIIYRPPEQWSFIDDFKIALKELASQCNEVYFFGDFNVNLFFEGHYVLKG